MKDFIYVYGTGYALSLLLLILKFTNWHKKRIRYQDLANAFLISSLSWMVVITYDYNFIRALNRISLKKISKLKDKWK